MYIWFLWDFKFFANLFEFKIALEYYYSSLHKYHEVNVWADDIELVFHGLSLIVMTQHKVNGRQSDTRGREDTFP